MTMYNYECVFLVNHFEIIVVVVFLKKHSTFLWQNTGANANTSNSRTNGRAVQCLR